MDTVRAAVIGLGEFGELHVDCLAHLHGVEVVSVVSRTAKRAREVAGRYCVATYFTRWDEMLDSVEVDAVHVTTEDSRHLMPTLAALRAGKHVLVEKPISHDIDEAKQMVREASDRDLILMVGHILRFHPQYVGVKERIASGKLGKVAYLYARRNMRKSAQEKFSYVPFLLRTGIHDIDLALWYLESNPVEVYAQARAFAGLDNDVYWGMIAFEDGALAVIETSWLLPNGSPAYLDASLEVMGTEGVAFIEALDANSAYWYSDRMESLDAACRPRLYGTTIGPLRDEIAYFISCVAARHKPELVKPEDSLRALQVSLAMLRSADTGSPVRLQGTYGG